ncbi:WD40 repeat-like protein, partial [Rhizopogon vinicolor AM-OR11-026]
RQTMRGRTGDVNGIVHLPDGLSIMTWTVASGSTEGTVRLWNVETEKVIAKWAGHTDIVRSLCWSADSERVVSGSGDGTVRVWNVESGKTPCQTMRGHTGDVNWTVHLPDGQSIITCSNYGSLQRWDLESGAQIGDDWRDGRDEAEVWCIALSPNGKTLASGNSEGTVRLWNIETEKVIAKWAGHTNTVWSLCWSADGERVVSGSHDGTARVWNVESGKTVLGPIQVHGSVYAVVHSPDMKKIATGAANENGVKIWDATTSELLS